MKDQIVRVKGTDKVPILLVANKVDLEHQREVPTVEGMVRKDEENALHFTSLQFLLWFCFQALAQIWGCSFIESSAKNRMNVNEVFAEIVREMNLKNSTKDTEIVCSCCVIS